MITVKPRVKLIAHTSLAQDGVIDGWMDVQEGSTDAETLTTFAGRACYQSFDRPSEATADDGDYLRRTVFEQQHGSIAEHASATFYLTGVSRALTHELIRHRHLSFSQMSQRFVDEGDYFAVLPPAIRLTGDGDREEVLHAFEYTGRTAADAYNRVAEVLTNAGLPRKQAREAARAVLPNMAETRIVVTGNLRAWQQVIDRRTAPDADAEIREVMGMIKRELHEHVSPVLFPIGDEN